MHQDTLDRSGDDADSNEHSRPRCGDGDGIGVGRSRSYVGGLLCENHDVLKLPRPADADAADPPKASLLYLDVMPGGKDSATRAQICRAVKYWPLPEEPPSDVFATRGHWHDAWQHAFPAMAGAMP